MRPNWQFTLQRLHVNLVAALTTCLCAFVAHAEQPLRVGMELSYPPFEMTDPQGKPTGVSVNLLDDGHARANPFDRIF